MKKLICTISLIIVLFPICSMSQTISFGSEIGGAIQYTNDTTSNNFFPGFNAGLFFNYSVINKFGFDGKIIYERFNKQLSYINFYPFVQYFGDDYTQFGIAPLIYYPLTAGSFNLSKPKIGAAFSFGNKYMGLNLSVIDFSRINSGIIPTIRLSAHFRIPFIDKSVH